MKKESINLFMTNDGELKSEYQVFTQEVCRILQEAYGESVQVRTNEVKKNNGITYVGVTIMEENSNISPTIYLENYFMRYQDGETIQKIVEEIQTVYRTNKGVNHFDIEFFKDYSLVRKQIACKLVNKEKNLELLENVPYVEFLDMAVVFYYVLPSELFENASILIQNSHIAIWELEVEELYKDALRNSPRMLRARLHNMKDILRDSIMENLRNQGITLSFEEWVESIDMGEEMMEYLNSEDQGMMYVLTNEKKMYGASCILYENLLQSYAEEFGESFFVLPSSVHEVILVGISDITKPDYLSEMVHNINETEVEEEEVLTDSVYFYDYNKKALEIYTNQEVGSY